MKQDNEILDRIEKLLEWYHNNHSKASILQLLEFQDKLSLYSCNLAKMTAGSKGNALRSYFGRKLSFSTNKMAYINLGETIGKSEELATISSKAEREKEIEDIEYSEYLNLLLKQVNKVLSTSQQRISFNKSEWERMHKLGDNHNQNYNNHV
jgi:hypothetical protein